ncbi:MAG: extracellular solute-binding protein, partial [Verrucomicrobiota bacterium]
SWIPQIKLYDSDSPKSALVNGDVDLGIVWSGEAAILIREHGSQFKYLLPSEGAHMFLDNLAIPKGAANQEAAHQFIDYILRPEISKLISDHFPYTNPNLEARKLLSEAQLGNDASYPASDPKLETFKDIGKAAREIDKLITDLKNR